ncbi:hypothetical protein AB0M39_41160 [Streptomyces sp. NPDC051907]|uniref:hypothetical protein n=1 Tax=Streptomyces sp. NPDC051907 TaxID=3155284 RepID=UPI00342ED587
MSSAELPREDGHDQVYRLTATGGDAKPESKYYLSAYQARSWRDTLRAAGYEAHAAVAPAAAFVAVDDEELELLAAAEVAAAEESGR